MYHHHLHYGIKVIFDYLSTYGYGFVFLGTLFEGEVVLLAAGFFAYLGVLNFWLVLLVGFTGAVIGDNIWYYIGRHGGAPFLNKYGKYFFLNEQRVARAKNYFDNHGNKTIFFSRFIFGTRISSAMLAGMLGMPRERFFVSNVLGAGAWAIITVTLGYFFGRSFEVLRHYFVRTEIALLILAGIVIIILILRYLFNRSHP